MTMRNDLKERVAGYVMTCPDKDLMKLDIDALAKRGRRPQPKRGPDLLNPTPMAKKIVFFAHFLKVLIKKPLVAEGI